MENIDLNIYTDEIKAIVDEWEQKLLALPEDVITERRNHQNRTVKQLLGHLVDSASNNHQRMIRLQYNNNLVFPDYTQDNSKFKIEGTTLNGYEIIRREKDTCYAHGALYDNDSLINTWTATMNKI